MPRASKVPKMPQKKEVATVKQEYYPYKRQYARYARYTPEKKGIVGSAILSRSFARYNRGKSPKMIKDGLTRASPQHRSISKKQISQGSPQQTQMDILNILNRYKRIN